MPPKSDEYTFTIDIENLIQTSSNCVLFGDFNAPHTAWNCKNNSSRGVRLLDFTAAVAEWYRYRNVACFVTSSSPVPLKTRRVGQRCTLNLSRAETSSRWCGVVVRRGGCQLRCRPRHLTMVQNYVVRRQKPSCS
ncbi:uncharacterized protein TNCV_4497681 [Trichonephila clavipes]|nr:uncharacterized protein TNCV_4497681 [Trichonephila clavipes]